MPDDILPFSSAFPEATEADWLREVEKALKGKGAETLTRKTADGLGIKALYRESDFAGAGAHVTCLRLGFPIEIAECDGSVEYGQARHQLARGTRRRRV